MSVDSLYMNPFPGAWNMIHLPLPMWRPVTVGNPDPLPPTVAQWAYSPTMQLEYWVFYRPVGVNPDPATIGLTFMLPGWIRRNRDGAWIDYGYQIWYWSNRNFTGVEYPVFDLRVSEFIINPNLS